MFAWKFRYVATTIHVLLCYLLQMRLVVVLLRVNIYFTLLPFSSVLKCQYIAGSLVHVVATAIVWPN